MWTLWYDDGGTFRDTDGEPWQSPPYGCVLVTQPGREREIVAGGEPYFVHRVDLDQWFGCDLAGLYDQLTHFAQHIDCVRIGRWMRGPDWRELVERANEACRAER